MPNSGKGDPSDPLRGVGSRGSQPLAPAGGIGGSEGSGAVLGPTQAAAAESVAGSLDTDAIASALASGAMDPATARTQLVEHAVRSQVPPGASEETIAAIRAEVEALLAHDPRLEQLLRP